MFNQFETPKKPELSPEQTIIADEIIKIFSKHKMSYLEALKIMNGEIYDELIYRYSQIVV